MEANYSMPMTRLRVPALLLAIVAILFLSSCQEPDLAPDDPHQAIVYGWDAMSSADYERAEAAFRKAAGKAKEGSDDYAFAIFGLGNSFQHRKPVADYVRAEEYYRQLVEKDKGHEVDSWSALAIARMHHLKLYEPGRNSDDTAASRAFRNLLLVIVVFYALAITLAYKLRNRSKWLGFGAVLLCAYGGTQVGKQFMVRDTSQKSAVGLPSVAELDKIREDYNRVLRDYPGTLASEEAAVFIGSSFIEQIDEASVRHGIDYLQTWRKEHAVSKHTANACGLIAGAHEMLEEYAPMMEALIAAVKFQEDPQLGDPNADLSNHFYRIAYIAENLTYQPHIAIEYYNRLKKKYPTDFRIFYCNRALKALGQTVTDEPRDEFADVSQDGGGSK
jgi:tetratricopeptide (TPR) repeat protein